MKLEALPYLRSVSLRDNAVADRHSYPFNIPAVHALGNIKFHPAVTFFVGENGAGKSTVLEAIALTMGYSPEGGTKNVQLATTDSTSQLHKELKTDRSFRKPKDGYFLRAESFFNVATYMDDVGFLDGYGGKSLHAQSHGESFMATLSQKLRGDGLYFLDEPEAALSPTRLMQAICVIDRLVNERSQFIIATHSPILLAYPNARIMLFDEEGIREIAYEETEHFKVTRDFLNNHQRRIEQLLAPNGDQ